jgi:hypothetical protein
MAVLQNYTALPSSSCSKFAPVANFSTNATFGCLNQALNFTDASTNYPATWSWNFGPNANPSTANTAGPISVNFNTTGIQTITLTSSNAYGTSTYIRAVTILGIPSLSNGIAGNTIVCPNEIDGYSVTGTSFSTNYFWSTPTGSSILNGQNTPNPNIQFGTISGKLFLTYGNYCASTTTGINITVRPAPPILGTIVGSTLACAGTNNSYSIIPVTNANSYFWTVPFGSIINSGQGTNAINVTLGSISGMVQVSAINNCGTGTSTNLSININNIPASLGPISGLSSVCANQNGVVFGIASLSGLNAYNWNLPTGASITSGIGTNSISVNFGTLGGNLSVLPLNSCGTGSGSNLAISNNPIQVTSVSIASSGVNVCSGTGVSLTASGVNAGTSPTYIWYINNLSQPGGNVFSYLPTNGDLVKVVLTAGGTIPVCLSGNPATSNGINLTVNPILTSAVAVSPSANPVCSGTGVTFTAVAQNSGSNPSYTWLIKCSPKLQCGYFFVYP